MKQIKMVCVTMAALLCAATANGQTKSKSKVNLKTDIDSLSYAAGVTYTQDLRLYLQGSAGIDTTEANIKEFLRGLNEGINASGDKKKKAYNTGIQIGQQISNNTVKGINLLVFGDDSTKTISIKNFEAGFVAGTTGKSDVMPIDSATQFFQKKMESYQAKQYGDNKKRGEAYMAKIAKTKGVKALGKGVYYKIITKGTGAVPTALSLVKINYEGKLIDGTKFDSSYEREEPTTFHVNQVISGWTEALTHMPVGSKWEIYVPQEQGYGAREAGPIRPFSALTFTIELLSIEEEEEEEE